MAFAIAGVAVCAAIQEGLGDFDEAAAGRHVEGGGTGDASAVIDVGSGLHEHVDESGAGAGDALVGQAVEGRVFSAVFDGPRSEFLEDIDARLIRSLTHDSGYQNDTGHVDLID